MENNCSNLPFQRVFYGQFKLLIQLRDKLRMEEFTMYSRTKWREILFNYGTITSSELRVDPRPTTLTELLFTLLKGSSLDLWVTVEVRLDQVQRNKLKNVSFLSFMKFILWNVGKHWLRYLSTSGTWTCLLLRHYRLWNSFEIYKFPLEAYIEIMFFWNKNFLNSWMYSLSPQTWWIWNVKIEW